MTVSQIHDLFGSMGKITWLLGGNEKRKKIFLEILAAHMELFRASGEIEEASTVSFSSINQASNPTTVPVFNKKLASANVITLSGLVAKYCSLVEALNTTTDYVIYNELF